MKQSGAMMLGCLALLAVAACSSAEPPPAEGSSRGNINFQGGVYTIDMSGGVTPQMDNSTMGNTVLDGRNGFHVECSVKGPGQPFSGSISSDDGTSLSVRGASASSGATFTGNMFGSATANGSAGGTVNYLQDPECTITKLDPITQPGSIWAMFQCKNLKTDSALGQVGTIALAEFLFTGCAK